jgi:hypothetical protein
MLAWRIINGGDGTGLEPFLTAQLVLFVPISTSAQLLFRALSTQTLPMESISRRLYHKKKLYSLVQIFFTMESI